MSRAQKRHKALITTPLSPMLVTNDVFTVAPFSYVIGTPTAIDVHKEDDDENSVRLGENKKKRTFLDK